MVPYTLVLVGSNTTTAFSGGDRRLREGVGERNCSLAFPGLSKFDALARAVSVNELDPGSFQSNPYRRFISDRHRNFALDDFHPTDCGDPHFGCCR
jgi:hypothetical protein